MDQKIDEKEGSCTKNGCRGCGACATKVIAALVLLLVGGLTGYLVGSRCGGMKMMAGCPMSTPAHPPAGK